MIPSPEMQKALSVAGRVFGQKNVGHCETLNVASTGDFAITRDIENHVREMGWNLGTMCGFQPRAITYRPLMIAKWDNIPASDYPKIDAILVCEDPRNGSMAFIIHRK